MAEAMDCPRVFLAVMAVSSRFLQLNGLDSGARSATEIGSAV
jgi:hypothetical protein